MQPEKYPDLASLTPEQLIKLNDEIEKMLGVRCNVATPRQVNPKSALFDTCQDPDVCTVEIDNRLLNDFQTMIGESNDIRKALLGFMAYYENHDSLNLILLHDVLQTRQSYTKFTAQLANYLVRNQRSFGQVKVQFDSSTTRLGVFCRKGTETSSLNSTFIGSVTAALKAYGSAEVSIEDIPVSYLGNRAAVKHLIAHKTGKTPRLIWSSESLKIFI